MNKEIQNKEVVATNKPDQVMIDREDFEQMKRQLAELKKEQAPGWAFAAPELYWLTGGGKSRAKPSKISKPMSIFFTVILLVVAWLIL